MPDPSKNPKATQKKPARPALFDAFTTETTRLGVQPRRRLTRSELREAYRLWAVHKDIRTGRAL